MWSNRARAAFAADCSRIHPTYVRWAGVPFLVHPLHQRKDIKLTFACPASLKADLDRYAALHAQAYGETVDAATLISHMLEAFMAGDRGFRKGRGGDTRLSSRAVAV